MWQAIIVAVFPAIAALLGALLHDMFAPSTKNSRIESKQLENDVQAVVGDTKQHLKDALFYRYQIGPYQNANFNAAVIDETIFEEIGGGQWKETTRSIRASDGVTVGNSATQTYVEVSRGIGEVQLKSEKTVPTRISDDGLYLFRDYPISPAPNGINPTEVKWWRMDGKGWWVSGRPQ